jgi:hypothetical protein
LSDEEIVEGYFQEKISFHVVIISDCFVSMCISLQRQPHILFVPLLLLPSVGSYLQNVALAAGGKIA